MTLVCALDAVARDDAVLFATLCAAHPTLLDTKPSDPYCNYFHYTIKSKHHYVVGLCVDETPTASAVANECGVSKLIYWGANTDPVMSLSLIHI